MHKASKKPALEMTALVLCQDPQFLGTTSRVLKQVGATAVLSDCGSAATLLDTRKFDAIIVDWREIDNLGEFLVAVRKSKHNQDSVLVAMVRDLLDLRQAFAAGVHFLIHKPVSAMQVEKCLRAAHSTFMARRRKQYRQHKGDQQQFRFHV